MGFVLTPAEAHRLIEKESRYAEVLFPYLNGSDLNTQPDQSPTRWVINFFDWPLDKAAQYTDCFEIVESMVKPERMRNNRRERRDKWWQYAEKCPALYRTITGMKQVLGIALTSKTLSPDFLPSNIVLDQTVVVFAVDTTDYFAVLASSLHYSWVLQNGATLRTDLRYTPSDCFETFPLPRQQATLAEIGNEYHDYRRRLMLDNQQGLTKTYNRFHNAIEAAKCIQKLRDLHIAMDEAVAAAYEWNDVKLNHDFHQTKQGLRFTISETARREILARLLKLNHERHAEELAQGLHDKKKPKRKPKIPPRESEESLFLPTADGGEK